MVDTTCGWLKGADGKDEAELFSRLIAAPEVGDNCNRSEIVLNAFATDVWIATPLEYKRIKGEGSHLQTVKDLIARRNPRPDWRRIVAFSCKEE